MFTGKFKLNYLVIKVVLRRHVHCIGTTDIEPRPKANRTYVTKIKQSYRKSTKQNILNILNNCP